jgi:hypothetical protein
VVLFCSAQWYNYSVKFVLPSTRRVILILLTEIEIECFCRKYVDRTLRVLVIGMYLYVEKNASI